MPVIYHTGDWFTLGQGQTYRRYEIYNMDWLQNADLGQMRVYGAPYGGPIAITKDPNAFTKVAGNKVKPTIKIYTASGMPLSTITVSII